MNHNVNSSELPKMAMEIPSAGPGALVIQALVKEGGRVTGYQLSNGQILDKDAAVHLARQGGIAGVGISEREGSEYLKSIPDSTEGNNLGNLPTATL